MPAGTRTLRVFVSSTFSDFHEETIAYPTEHCSSSFQKQTLERTASNSEPDAGDF